MSLEEWSDLHGEDYPKQKLFSALDWGRGDRTCIRITCDYCEQQFEIKEDELDDWTVIDPESGDKAVMCGECESRRTKRAPDVWESAPLQALSTPEHSATSQTETAPAQRV